MIAASVSRKMLIGVRTPHGMRPLPEMVASVPSANSTDSDTSMSQPFSSRPRRAKTETGVDGTSASAMPSWCEVCPYR